MAKKKPEVILTVDAGKMSASAMKALRRHLENNTLAIPRHTPILDLGENGQMPDYGMPDPGAPPQYFIEKMRAGYCVMQEVSFRQDGSRSVGSMEFEARGVILPQPVAQLTRSDNLEKELDELIGIYGLDNVGAVVSERILAKSKAP